MRLSRKVIKLSTRDGDVFVHAKCSPNFGLHHEYFKDGPQRGRYKVTHLPSGLSMHGDSCSQAIGRKYIELLEATTIDWGLPKDELGKSKAICEIVRQAREESGLLY